MNKLYRLFAICFCFGVLSPQVGALGNPDFVFSEDGLGGVLFIKALDIDGVKAFGKVELELDFTTSTFTLKKIENTTQNTLLQSKKTWKTLKNANNGEYSYSRSFQSWAGFKYTTRFTVKDDIVNKREYEFSSDPSIRNTWVEEGADVGTHQEGHDVLLIEQLYEHCEKEVLTKNRASHFIFFELDSNGLLKTCIGVPKNCADDCRFGVEIEKITFGK